MAAHFIRRANITLVNERRIARDGKGRIYQERWALVPKNGDSKSTMTAIQIADPLRHLLYTCRMDMQRVCDETAYTEPVSASPDAHRTHSETLPNGFLNQEDLGDGSFEGVDTIGTRVTRVFNPGAFGNDNQVTVEREFWYSQQLGINLLSKVDDPRFGRQSFTVSNLSLGEPDPKVFELPQGFRVMDHRSTPIRASARDPSGSEELQ